MGWEEIKLAEAIGGGRNPLSGPSELLSDIARFGEAGTSTDGDRYIDSAANAVSEGMPFGLLMCGQTKLGFEKTSIDLPSPVPGAMDSRTIVWPGDGLVVGRRCGFADCSAASDQSVIRPTMPVRRVMLAGVADTRKGMGDGAIISVSADSRADRFAGLFREFIPSVRGYVRTLVAASDVEPVVQATFETAWVKIEAIPLLSQRAWLFGVARNHVRNHVRAERRRTSLVEALVSMRPVEDTDPFLEGADAVHLAPLLVALGQMSDGERELIQLLAWHEMGPAEIAVVLGVSQNAARVRVHRARKRLSMLLDSITEEVTS